MRVKVTAAPPGTRPPRIDVRAAKSRVLDAVGKGRAVEITTLTGLVAIVELYTAGLIQLALESDTEV